MEQDEVDFKSLMQDVKPLPTSNKVSSTLTPPKIKIKPSNLAKHKTKWNLDEVEKTQLGAFDSVAYQHPSVRKKDWDRLKKGHFKTHWQLDLHGLNTEDADKYLQDFFDQAWSNSARYLIIIHGKGYHSDEQHPILKNLVLQRCQQNQQVLAFCSAQPKDGGTGAMYVFLKKLEEFAKTKD